MTGAARADLMFDEWVAFVEFLERHVDGCGARVEGGVATDTRTRGATFRCPRCAATFVLSVAGTAYAQRQLRQEHAPP
jgi:hypothetical protein